MGSQRAEAKYRKTPKGFLVRSYWGLQKRSKEKGLPCFTRAEFYDFGLKSSEFHRLLKQYRDSGWEPKLAPSVDRIDPERGYTLDNVQWLTVSENSKKYHAYIRNRKWKSQERSSMWNGLMRLRIRIGIHLKNWALTNVRQLAFWLLKKTSS